MYQLDPEGWSMEGLPGGQDEGERGGACCLAPNQTRRSPYTGTRTGEKDGWMKRVMTKNMRMIGMISWFKSL